MPHLEQEVLRQKARADRFKDQLASAPAATAKGGSSDDFEAKKKVTSCTSLIAGLDNIMQLFMWQRDIVGVAHHVMACFDALDAF